MKHQHGSLEVITGSMFSGKTDELIRRLRRATIARQKVQVFKPVIDNRYAIEKVTSHAGTDYHAIPIHNSTEIWAQLEAEKPLPMRAGSREYSPSMASICFTAKASRTSSRRT